MSSEKFERDLWLLDQKINATGLYFDRQAVERSIKFIDEFYERSLSELLKLTHGQVKTPKQVKKLKGWLIERGCKIESLSKESVLNVLARPDLPPDVRRALEIRQVASLSSVSKFQAFLSKASSDDRIRGHLMFHGASTGRWTGKGVQFQNLPRGVIKDTDTCIDIIKNYDLETLEAFYGNPLGAISSCIRGMITASPGNILRCADFKSVEARCLAWIAGEKEVVNAFMDGLDIYKVAAAGIYNVKYDNVTAAQRQIGKVAILALGYQGSVGAFNKMAAGYGVEMEDDKVKEIVSKFRDSNSQIVKFWYDLEKAAIKTVKFGEPKGARGIMFEKKKGFLFMVLPSGRRIAYCEPEIGQGTYGKDQVSFMTVNSVTKKWERTFTYGGKLVENAIQAICRDFMANSMLELDKAGFNLTLTVHDEIMSDDPKGFKSLDEFIAIMKKPPKWGYGMPLDADGWEGHRYRK